MRLLNQHFFRHHKYYKLFNRKNIKLIYSFMPNMNNVIRKHNSKIVKNRTPCTLQLLSKNRLPMNGNCLSECLINKVSVNTTTDKYYFGTCENTFKERQNIHKSPFRNKSCDKNTELSKYVQELKERDINYFIDLGIAMKQPKYVWESRKCDLCNCEKVFVLRADPNVLLNKRDDDVLSKC